MNRLWVKLTLVFGLITISTFLIVAVTIHYQVNREFRRFIAADQLWDTGAVQRLSDYYAEHGSWEQVEDLFETWRRGPHASTGSGMGQGQGRGPPTILLTDADGWVVYDEAGLELTDKIPPGELAHGVPIQWQEHTVGYVLMAQSEANLPPRAMNFLSEINVLLPRIGLVIVSLGIVLGLAIARSLSAPLAHLETAARHISQGNLEQRVVVSGTREIASVARAFNDMAASLQRDHELRRTMVADIAHELRTPISVLQGNLRALLDDVYPLEKQEIATIYDETLLLSRLVNDLRELAQAEAGQLDLNIQSTDIKRVIEHSTVLFSELATERGIAFRLTMADDLPHAQADADRVQQVIYNLVANALRHTPEGDSVTIGAEVWSPVLESPPLDAARNAPHGYICISVTDTGSGIPAEYVPHLFERFWRADKSRSREHGGSGLGLAITRYLVEAQGGAIGVESEVGHGSHFWFTLPCADDGKQSHTP